MFSPTWLVYILSIMYHKQVYFLLNKDTYLRFSVPPFKEAKSKYELKNSNYLIFVICNSSQGFVNWMSLEWVVSKTKSSRFLVTYKMFMPRFYLILSSSVSSLFVSLSEKEFLAFITVINKAFYSVFSIFSPQDQFIGKWGSTEVLSIYKYTKKQTRITTTRNK